MFLDVPKLKLTMVKDDTNQSLSSLVTENVPIVASVKNSSPLLTAPQPLTPAGVCPPTVRIIEQVEEDRFKP